MQSKLPSDVVLSGQLEHEGQLLPVTVAHASRLSLHVAFQEGTPPADRTEFSRLLLEVRDRPVELTRCRLEVEYTRRGYSGRLVFLDDVYDVNALLFEGKFVNLKGFFQNLPLVLGQKEHIRPDFREYLSGLTYDLSVYKRFFNEQDRILANEPPQVARAAQQSLMRTEGRAFFGYLDAQLERLGELVQGFTKEQHEQHGFFLRRQLWEYILGSEFLKRTNIRPRGYAGDAEMMLMLYQNRYVGNYVFHQLLHKHPVECPAAQAVRNRRAYVPRMLRRTQECFSALPPGGFHVLSVASGPAWELQDIFTTPEDFERLHVTLLDQDETALAAARAGIERLEGARNGRVRASFLNESVRTMLRTRELAERFGRYHFIYSMGLFDYLTPPVARAVLAKLYSLLEPGGVLVVGNYHVAHPSRLYMEYWMDWVLYLRTEEDMLELAEGLPGARASVSFEETRSQMFLQLERGS